MKSIIHLLLLGVPLGFASCSPKQAAPQAERLNWNEATLVRAYDTIGRQNPKWDAPARRALTEFSRVRAGVEPDDELRFDFVGALAREAIAAGCDDPMIRYLYCRNAPASDKTLEGWQAEFRAMAQGMEVSGYPPIRKFYASLRASNVLWENRNTNLWPEVRQFRVAAVSDLAQALRDKSTPALEISQAAQFLFTSVAPSDYQLTNFYFQIEQPLFETRPRAAVSYLVKAKFYYTYAWRARGGGYASRVTEARWKLFFARLKESEAALNRAWSLDPKDPAIAAMMIRLCEGQQKPREEMERWFRRAMALDTNNYAACHNKLHYLLPQWYGSRAEMVAFGRQCVASTNWGGRVPLILVDAHWDFARFLGDQDEAARYWTSPDVWPDIAAAYGKFFRLNPDATGYRRYYARYAYWCGQWKSFLEQIELLKNSDEGLDEAFFGGQEALDKMVANARRGSA